MGRDYDEVLHLKKFRRSEREHTRALAVPRTGGATSGVKATTSLLSVVDSDGLSDSLPSLAVLEAFYSFVASSLLSDPMDTLSFPAVESDVFSLALHATSPYPSQSARVFDLSKPPSSYSEAIARSDASAWRAAMNGECQSLINMGAFEEADLPPGQRAVGLKWVYDIKTDALGNRIPGKEKAL